MNLPELILAEFESLGLTHVLTVPDNSSKPLLDALWSDRKIPVVSVTREGEAFAIASGLWVGGQRPVVLIQNTGLLESGDALRGTAMRMRVPLLCLVTYRGFAKLQGTHLNPAAPAENAELLGRPDVDSVALLTEPTLRAWNIPYDFLHDHGDVSKIPRAFQQAQELRQPVALLLTV